MKWYYRSFGYGHQVAICEFLNRLTKAGVGEDCIKITGNTVYYLNEREVL